MSNPITKEAHGCTAYQVYCYVHVNFDASNMIVIDEEFMVKYPQITQQ